MIVFHFTVIVILFLVCCVYMMVKTAQSNELSSFRIYIMYHVDQPKQTLITTMHDFLHLI